MRRRLAADPSIATSLPIDHWSKSHLIVLYR
jgi:hypothetical protein